MTTAAPQARIRATLERAVKAMTLRDTVGKGTATTAVRLSGGLACETTEGAWTFRTDMAEQMAGEGSAPTPGFYGRMAIGTCFATSLAMWAARLGVPVDGVEVDVEADFDARGEFGIDPSIPGGYLAIRLRVRVTSDAPQADLDHLLETTERHTSWLDLMRRPVDATVHASIIRGE